MTRSIHWYKKWDKVLDESRDPFYRWFAGGEVNTCYNAIDRHIANGQKILRGTMQKIADSQEYKVPAMIDDPAALAEIQEVLSRSGSDNAGSHP